VKHEHTFKTLVNILKNAVIVYNPMNPLFILLVLIHCTFNSTASLFPIKTSHLCKIMSSLFSFDCSYLGMYSTTSQTKYSFGKTKIRLSKKYYFNFVPIQKDREKQLQSRLIFFRHMLYKFFSILLWK
jgi:hypothetical protein